MMAMMAAATAKTTTTMSLWNIYYIRTGVERNLCFIMFVLMHGAVCYVQHFSHSRHTYTRARALERIRWLHTALDKIEWMPSEIVCIVLISAYDRTPRNGSFNCLMIEFHVCVARAPARAPTILYCYFMMYDINNSVLLVRDTLTLPPNTHSHTILFLYARACVCVFPFFYSLAHPQWINKRLRRLLDVNSLVLTSTWNLLSLVWSSVVFIVPKTNTKDAFVRVVFLLSMLL